MSPSLSDRPHQPHQPPQPNPTSRLRFTSVLAMCLGLMLAWVSLDTHAARERAFPAHVKRGTMVPRDPPNVLIDGKPRLLASGVRIRDERNHLQHPGHIQGEQFIIHYTENHMGNINQIWILTPEEIHTALPNATPTPKPQPRPIQNSN